MPNEPRRRSAPIQSALADDRTSAPAELSIHAISDRAYELYEGRGGEHGHDIDDWLQAERELHTSVTSTRR
jgi:hypothetical protein